MATYLQKRKIYRFGGDRSVEDMAIQHKLNKLSIQNDTADAFGQPAIAIQRDMKGAGSKARKKKDKKIDKILDEINGLAGSNISMRDKKLTAIDTSMLFS